MALTEAYTPQGINVGINWGVRPAPASSITCTCTWCRAERRYQLYLRDRQHAVLPEELGQTAARLRPSSNASKHDG
jgi:hypothetical protein